MSPKCKISFIYAKKMSSNLMLKLLYIICMYNIQLQSELDLSIDTRGRTRVLTQEDEQEY